MNLLIDRPPETVMIGGTEYEINTDFRASILFELLMQDDEVDDVEKIYKAVDLYFPEDYPDGEDLMEIFKAIAWFYLCGRPDKERKLGAELNNTDDTDNKETTDEKSEEESEEEPEYIEDLDPAYSFDFDDEYIYAEFRKQYGIILTEVEYMHWWEFRAMFKGLDPDCLFCKIMGYRKVRITSDMSKSEKAFLQKMKSVHALPISEKEYQRTNALAEALMNGGDVDKLLGYKEAGNG